MTPPHRRSSSQLDLLAVAGAPLPGVDELQKRFAAFNDEFFGARLPAVVIRWSARMRIAGTCERHRGIITLSRPYHEHFPEDVDDTLKHEMIHLRYRGHGPAFHREARRIGASVHCKHYSGLHPKATLRYICPNCHHEFKRMKPGDLYCGSCGRGRPDPRFRLILLESRHTKARRVREISTGGRGADELAGAGLPIQASLL